MSRRRVLIIPSLLFQMNFDTSYEQGKFSQNYVVVRGDSYLLSLLRQFALVCNFRKKTFITHGVMNVEKNLRCQWKESRRVPVIPTRTNFIAKARNRINAFIRRNATERVRERFYCNFYYNIAHISSPKKFLHSQI